MLSLKLQKYIIISLLFYFNLILCSTFIIYESKWYMFLVILAIGSCINSISSINLIITKLSKKSLSNLYYRIEKKNYVYVIPCYNENEEELRGTIDSLNNQICHNTNDKKCLIIICDGKVIGNNNSKSTNMILIENILNNSEKKIISKGYKCWDNSKQNLEIYQGLYNNIPYIVLIKDINYGKRDSLVLIRRLLFNYNFQKEFCNNISISLQNIISSYLRKIFVEDKIDYLIGTDADTIFSPNCTEELLKSINKTPYTVGVVGFVDISPKCNSYSFYTLYQKAEYYYAQCLKRQHQSLITHKVNCLSGCVQILKICFDTCGEEILSKFNELPSKDDSIFRHIRAYASEDRNHVCLMLSYYPKLETRQNLNAIAYTNIPMSKDVFLSQRRRWTLGATCNDIMLLFLPNINKWEKLVALTNIIIFSASPFIFVATIYFIKAIINHASLLMLFLSIIILIPFFYMILIPLFIKPLKFNKLCELYISFICYLIFGSSVNLCIWIYSLYYMDNLTWGKTRSIQNIDNTNINSNNTNITSNNTNITSNNNNNNNLSSNIVIDNNILNNKNELSSEINNILSNENLSSLIDEYQQNKYNNLNNQNIDNKNIDNQNMDEFWDYNNFINENEDYIEILPE